MRQVLRVVGVLVAGAFVFTAVTPPATAGIEGDKFQVVTRTIDEHFEDVGREGPSVGDTITISEKLFNRGERVGRDAVHCQLTQVTKKVFRTHCIATLTLRGKGDLTAQGVVTFKRGGSNSSDLAVTGGTGDYEGAAGVVTVVEQRDEPTRLRVRLSG